MAWEEEYGPFIYMTQHWCASWSWSRSEHTTLQYTSLAKRLFWAQVNWEQINTGRVLYLSLICPKAGHKFLFEEGICSKYQGGKSNYYHLRQEFDTFTASFTSFLQTLMHILIKTMCLLFCSSAFSLIHMVLIHIVHALNIRGYRKVYPLW